MSDVKTTPQSAEQLFAWRVFDDSRDVLEALIFAADTPLTAARISEIIPSLPEDGVAPLVELLNQDYLQNGRSFEIVRVGGGYHFRTRSGYSDYIRKLLKAKIHGKLSAAALETLSVVAYRQPVTRAEIESLRGVSVDASLRTLLDRDLIRITGRSEKIGRALLYGTTAGFLTYFGLNSLKDLPELKEIEGLVKREGDQSETE